VTWITFRLAVSKRGPNFGLLSMDNSNQLSGRTIPILVTAVFVTADWVAVPRRSGLEILGVLQPPTQAPRLLTMNPQFGGGIACRAREAD
jgi:hypothetical protein